MPDRTASSFGLDDLDRKIIAILKDDGRISNQQLSRKLGVTAMVLGQRIKRLERHDIVRLTLVADFKLIGCELLMAAGFQTCQRSARAVAEDLARLPQTFSVSTMLGRFPVEALIALPDIAALKTFVERDLASISGIAGVEFNLAADMPKYEFDVVPFGDALPPIRMTSPLLDDLDQRIIAAFSNDPRKNNSAVGEELGIAEGTVRARLKRLRERGLIRFSVLTNAHKVGTAHYVFVRIQADVARVRAVTEAITAIPEARCVIMTAGTHNIMALGHFDADVSAGSPIDRIMMIPGVMGLETSHVTESLKYDFRVAKIIGG